MTDAELEVELRVVRRRLKEKVDLIHRAIGEAQKHALKVDDLEASLDLDATLTTALQEAFEISVGDVALKLWKLWRRDRKLVTANG